MKSKIYLVLLAFMVFLFPVRMTGQHEQLKALLEDKTDFREITGIFEQYLGTLPEGIEKDRLWKHYARWAFYQSMHLGPNGEFVNITQRTLTAAQTVLDAPTTTANGIWTFVGPSYSTTNNPDADLNGIGRMDRIAFDPSNSSIIYTGATSGGLWKSTNGGSSWTPLSDFIPSVGISGIVVDWSNSSRIYVLTGDGDSFLAGGFVNNSGYIRKSAGVLVSNDGGSSWQMTGPLATVDYVGYQLRQHPTNASILLAATSNGIYKTTNGGTTWTQVRPGKHWDIEFKPGTPSRVYASAPGAFVYSTNTGDTWNTDATFANALCAGGRVELAVTPDAVNYVYLLSGPANTGGANTFCGFWRSTNSGSSFTRLCTSPNVLGKENGSGDQSDYDIGLCVHPTNYLIVIAAGLCTYKSTDGGNSFTSLTTYRESGGNYIHPDIHMVAYNPLNNYLWAVGDGGAHRSTNNGTSWTDYYNLIETTQFYHMTDYDGNQYALLGGCQDNGVKYRTTNTTNFSHIYCCDGFDGVIQFNNVNKGYQAVNDRVFRYTNFTTTAPTQIRDGSYFMMIEMHVSNSDIVYIGDNYVYEYDASTGVTTRLGTTAHGQWALRTCPSNSLRIYAAGGTSAFASTGAMYYSPDNGSTWSTISGNTGFPTPFPRISCIGVRPNGSGFVYATFSGYTDGVKVVYSSNNGSSWTNISYDLPNIPIWSIVVDESNNVYVGGDFGVYFRASGATHWEPFSNYLALAPVSDLAINETNDLLYASTFGRGIWKSPLHATCGTDVSIIGNLFGLRFYSASNSITMSSQVIGGIGTNVDLRAGNFVTLVPGFRANASDGSTFLGYLGPCESGMPPDSPQMTGDVIWPKELAGYKKQVCGELGTLEVKDAGDGQRQVIVRITKPGNGKILLARINGESIKDVAALPGTPGKYTYDLGLSGLTAGMYYLYLVVDGTTTHMQELEIL